MKHALYAQYTFTTKLTLFEKFKQKEGCAYISELVFSALKTGSLSTSEHYGNLLLLH
jgi:hypothetical protein